MLLALLVVVVAQHGDELGSGREDRAERTGHDPPHEACVTAGIDEVSEQQERVIASGLALQEHRPCRAPLVRRARSRVTRHREADVWAARDGLHDRRGAGTGPVDPCHGRVEDVREQPPACRHHGDERDQAERDYHPPPAGNRVRLVSVEGFDRAGLRGCSPLTAPAQERDRCADQGQHREGHACLDDPGLERLEQRDDDQGRERDDEAEQSTANHRARRAPRAMASLSRVASVHGGQRSPRVPERGLRARATRRAGGR